MRQENQSNNFKNQYSITIRRDSEALFVSLGILFLWILHGRLCRDNYQAVSTVVTVINETLKAPKAFNSSPRNGWAHRTDMPNFTRRCCTTCLSGPPGLTSFAGKYLADRRLAAGSRRSSDEGGMFRWHYRKNWQKAPPSWARSGAQTCAENRGSAAD